MKSDDSALIAAKQDLAFLKEVLGLAGDKTSDNHAKCPSCGDTCLSYSYRPSANGAGTGACVFNCKKEENFRGTVIDALMYLERLSMPEAIRKAKERYKGGQLPPPRPMLALPAPQEELKFGSLSLPPVLDRQRTEDFIERYHEWLVERPEISRKFKRGISLDVIRRYRIGFVENESIRITDADWTINVPGAWVLPITDEMGQVMAVKLHFENPKPMTKSGPMKGKNIWMPFGTIPAYDKANDIKPRKSYYCLWPHINQQPSNAPKKSEWGYNPDWYIQRIPRDSELEREWLQKFDEERAIYALEIRKTFETLESGEINTAMMRAWAALKGKIMKTVVRDTRKDGAFTLDLSKYCAIVAGELKALAGISAGVVASSSTGGESWIPPPEVLRAYKGRDVIIVVDEDPPKKTQTNDGGASLLCTGLEYGRKLALALLREGASDVRIKSGGRSE